MNVATDAPELPRVPELEPMYLYGFTPRRKEMLFICGQPGAGKSAFALWYADQLGIPTLYFSADMAPHTAVTRLTAKRTGMTIDEVASDFDEGLAFMHAEDIAGSQVHFCFDSGPTLSDIADELSAYCEVYDRYPELIVVDNLMNIESGDEDDFAGQKFILKELHRLARETGAAVFILHHLREEGDATQTQPRSAIQGKVAQLPERILNLALDPMEQCLKLAYVKNRSGRQDASGKTYGRLRAWPERSTFTAWIGTGF
jgi:RecA-family ATPase